MTSERIPPPPNVYRLPDRRLVDVPSYTGWLRRRTDYEAIGDRATKTNRGLIIIGVYVTAALCLALGIWLVVRLTL